MTPEESAMLERFSKFRKEHNALRDEILAELKQAEAPKALQICPMCEQAKDTVEVRRRKTAYVDDENNWLTCCAECIAEDDAYYQELWDEYYFGRL